MERPGTPGRCRPGRKARGPHRSEARKHRHTYEPVRTQKPEVTRGWETGGAAEVLGLRERQLTACEAYVVRKNEPGLSIHQNAVPVRWKLMRLMMPMPPRRRACSAIRRSRIRSRTARFTSGDRSSGPRHWIAMETRDATARP